MKGLNVIYDWKRVQFNTELWVMKINLPKLLIRVNKVNYYKRMFPLVLLQ